MSTAAGAPHSQAGATGRMAAACEGRAILLVPLHPDGPQPGRAPPGPAPQLGGLPGSLVCFVRFTDCFLKTSELVLIAH